MDTSHLTLRDWGRFYVRLLFSREIWLSWLFLMLEGATAVQAWNVAEPWWYLLRAAACMFAVANVFVWMTFLCIWLRVRP